MKTTVKTATGSAMVAPLENAGEIVLALVHKTGEGFALVLTPDQCGALIFGMEQAMEVIDQRHRAALETMRVEA